jgi:hypothetical protein
MRKGPLTNIPTLVHLAILPSIGIGGGPEEKEEEFVVVVAAAAAVAAVLEEEEGRTMALPLANAKTT